MKSFSEILPLKLWFRFNFNLSTKVKVLFLITGLLNDFLAKKFDIKSLAGSGAGP